MGKFGCDGVIFVGVIVKNIMLVKIAGHAHTHYPVTLKRVSQALLMASWKRVKMKIQKTKATQRTILMKVTQRTIR